MAYSLGPVKPHVKAAAESIGTRFHVKTIYGFGGGSVPGSDHPKGLALDLMINNIPNGHAMGEAIASYAIANASALGIKYVIWNRRIWRNGQWKAYSGPRPHTDHVHLSFNATPGSGVPSNTGGTVTTPVGLPLVPDWIEKLGDPALWRKIAWTTVGFLMIMIGIILLVGKQAANITVSGVAGKAAKAVISK